jgi:hypothetical protein
MVHPCRASADTGGNPSFKMHACSSEESEVTLCGLRTPLEVDVLAGYASMCRTCFPPKREEAWTAENNNSGDPIEGEGRGDEESVS